MYVYLHMCMHINIDILRYMYTGILSYTYMSILIYMNMLSMYTYTFKNHLNIVSICVCIYIRYLYAHMNTHMNEFVSIWLLYIYMIIFEGENEDIRSIRMQVSAYVKQLQLEYSRVELARSQHYEGIICG
jgi:hypothetical protein